MQKFIRKVAKAALAIGLSATALIASIGAAFYLLKKKKKSEE